jgi:hypothetical protein
MSKLLLSVLFLALTSTSLVLIRMERSSPTAALQPEALLAGLENKQQGTLPAISLTGYTLRVMDRCGAKLSAVYKPILAAQIGTIVEAEFGNDRKEAEAFIALLCIESKFEQGAKSTVGATGIAQLMPQYAQGFATSCGLGKLGEGDIQQTAVNLHLGACYFHQLLKQFNGNIALALAGYNSGAGSGTTRKLGGLGTGAEETSGYLAKHYVLSESVSSGSRTSSKESH